MSNDQELAFVSQTHHRRRRVGSADVDMSGEVGRQEPASARAGSSCSSRGPSDFAVAFGGIPLTQEPAPLMRQGSIGGGALRVPPSAPPPLQHKRAGAAASASASSAAGSAAASRKPSGGGSSGGGIKGYIQYIPGVNTNAFLPPRAGGAKTGRVKARPRPIAAPGGAVSRYMKLFEELSLLGTGGFCDVYRARSRMDGCTYAVKRRRDAVHLRGGGWTAEGAPTAARTTELKEVHALAALGGHPHMVRYLSAWREDEHLYIQTELAWGSLEDAVAGRRPGPRGTRRLVRLPGMEPLLPAGGAGGDGSGLDASGTGLGGAEPVAPGTHARGPPPIDAKGRTRQRPRWREGGGDEDEADDALRGIRHAGGLRGVSGGLPFDSLGLGSAPSHSLSAGSQEPLSADEGALPLHRGGGFARGLLGTASPSVRASSSGSGTADSLSSPPVGSMGAAARKSGGGGGGMLDFSDVNMDDVEGSRQGASRATGAAPLMSAACGGDSRDALLIRRPAVMSPGPEGAAGSRDGGLSTGRVRRPLMLPLDSACGATPALSSLSSDDGLLVMRRPSAESAGAGADDALASSPPLLPTAAPFSTQALVFSPAAPADFTGAAAFRPGLTGAGAAASLPSSFSGPAAPPAAPAAGQKRKKGDSRGASERPGDKKQATIMSAFRKQSRAATVAVTTTASSVGGLPVGCPDGSAPPSLCVVDSGSCDSSSRDAEASHPARRQRLGSAHDPVPSFAAIFRGAETPACVPDATATPAPGAQSLRLPQTLLAGADASVLLGGGGNRTADASVLLGGQHPRTVDPSFRLGSRLPPAGSDTVQRSASASSSSSSSSSVDGAGGFVLSRMATLGAEGGAGGGGMGGYGGGDASLLLYQGLSQADSQPCDDELLYGGGGSQAPMTGEGHLSTLGAAGPTGGAAARRLAMDEDDGVDGRGSSAAAGGLAVSAASSSSSGMGVARGGLFDFEDAAASPPAAPATARSLSAGVRFAGLPDLSTSTASPSTTTASPAQESQGHDAVPAFAPASLEPEDACFSQTSVFMGTQQGPTAGSGGPVGPPPLRPYRLCATDLLLVLSHVGRALAHMHGEGFAHLDVKPSNVLVTYGCGPRMTDADGEWRPEMQALTGVPSTDALLVMAVAAVKGEEEGVRLAALEQLAVAGLSPADLLAPPPMPHAGALDATTTSDAAASFDAPVAAATAAAPIDLPSLRRSVPVIYKLGDMGQVAPVTARDVFEGDARYLSRELLNGDTANLPAADVFALGLSCVELATGVPLPTGDDAYAALRDGALPLHLLGHLPVGLVELLAAMIAPDPGARPTAEQLVAHPLVTSLIVEPGTGDVRLPELEGVTQEMAAMMVPLAQVQEQQAQAQEAHEEDAGAAAAVASANDDGMDVDGDALRSGAPLSLPTAEADTTAQSPHESWQLVLSFLDACAHAEAPRGAPASAALVDSGRHGAFRITGLVAGAAALYAAGHMQSGNDHDDPMGVGTRMGRSNGIGDGAGMGPCDLDVTRDGDDRVHALAVKGTGAASAMGESGASTVVSNAASLRSRGRESFGALSMGRASFGRSGLLLPAGDGLVVSGDMARALRATLLPLLASAGIVSGAAGAETDL